MRHALDILGTTYEAEREFADGASTFTDAVSRREFLNVMGASLALAGASGCTLRQPDERLVPYVRKPEQITPGKPLYYATAMPHAGSAIGLLVESHQGRPTKIEGNPEHPASLGATDAIAQASILGLYDPDRSQALRYVDRIRGWSDFVGEIQRVMREKIRPTDGGAGLRIISEVITSPTLAAQREELLRSLPGARWYQYEPSVSGSGHEGTRILFGEPLDVRYQFAAANVIVTLDADPFTGGPGHLAYARDFAARRQPGDGMNRHYAVESTPTPSGMRADHRLPVRGGQIETVARALAAAVGPLDAQVELPTAIRRWVDAVADDLKANRGKCVIVPGEHQPPEVHALAHAMNRELGNAGTTLVFTKPAVEPPAPSIRALCDDINRKKFELLVILGGNPVFTAPADLQFKDVLLKVPLRVHLGLYDDETSRWCQWHIPESHYLETWGDARSFDGTCTIMQPLIAPLYGGKSAIEVVAALGDQPSRTGHEIVREHWRRHHESRRMEGAFDRFWRESLHEGVVRDTRSPDHSPTLRTEWRGDVLRSQPQSLTKSHADFELIFRPDPTIHDGRFANNGWLQELPKPLTKLTWDNAAIVSPNTAAILGVGGREGKHGGAHGEYVADTIHLALSTGERLVKVPVLVLPGQPDGSITLHYGYGRTAAGRVGNGTGFNAYALRRSATPFFTGGATVTRAGGKYILASTANHFMLQGENAYERGTVRVGTLSEYKRNPTFPHDRFHHHNGPLPAVAGFRDEHADKPPAIGDKPLDLYPPYKYDGYKWAMVVDLNACTGCGGCVVACQSENNIPVVGKDQVTRAREMHWLRIDQYYHGDPAKPETISAAYQPLMCVHCENAPCEVVCPVEATSHSPDGLNEMTYNRCVGTRYCSNNCPYKVRRFNFLAYSDYATESLKPMRNPDVTVRSRGVMEKCTFCVQRIRGAEISAKQENRYGPERGDRNRPDLAYVRDGEVVTACQAACPTGAIVFGDMNDVTPDGKPRSKVARLKQDPRDYGLLSELNTRPRLTYLAAVRNPNPALEPEAGRHG